MLDEVEGDGDEAGDDQDWPDVQEEGEGLEGAHLGQIQRGVPIALWEKKSQCPICRDCGRSHEKQDQISLFVPTPPVRKNSRWRSVGP